MLTVGRKPRIDCTFLRTYNLQNQSGSISIIFLPSAKPGDMPPLEFGAPIQRDLFRCGVGVVVVVQKEKPVVMLEKDVVVGGDRAGEDGDGVGNFGVGGGGFNRSCCCILVAQILGWRAIPSRAKLGELILAESKKMSRAA
jgi:hypothetical protein